MSGSDDAAAAIEAALGRGVTSVVPVRGGDISRAWRVESPAGHCFAKTLPGAPPDFFTTEAAGLAWLREPGALDVPRVLGVSAGALVLEWVDEGAASRTAEERLGRGLAAVHRAGAPAFGAVPPGGGSAGFLARLGVSDRPAATWHELFVHQRLLPLAAEADRRGALPSGTRAALERLADRLLADPEALAGPPEPPARLHGDLWAGNVLWGAGERPWLIDPAAHGGHRETDLAMMRLFGGFGPAAFAAYHEAHPLTDGWEQRVDLHQLTPLLVHACLFGGGYGHQVGRVVKGLV